MSRFIIYTAFAIAMLLSGFTTLGITLLILTSIVFLIDRDRTSTPQLKIVEKTLKDGGLRYEAHIKESLLNLWYIEREGSILRWVEVAGHQELDRLIKAKTAADSRVVVSEKVIKQIKGDQ